MAEAADSRERVARTEAQINARIEARQHPLALDLVDYVERSRTPAITIHLRSCLSCRQGVWNICGDDEVRRELFTDVFAYRPDLGDALPSTCEPPGGEG